MNSIEARRSDPATDLDDISSLVDLSVPDDWSPLDTRAVDTIRVLAADAVQSARVAAPQREITLKVGESELPPMVTGDAARLTQVIRNLVNNAVVHTPPEASITVGVGVEGDEVVLSVADTGQGLTAEETAQVFERFYRADTSRTRASGGGSGLGLAITKSLVEAHGGTITVATVEGEGSRSTISLPAA